MKKHLRCNLAVVLKSSLVCSECTHRKKYFHKSLKKQNPLQILTSYASFRKILIWKYRSNLENVKFFIKTSKCYRCFSIYHNLIPSVLYCTSQLNKISFTLTTVCEFEAHILV